MLVLTCVVLSVLIVVADGTAEAAAPRVSAAAYVLMDADSGKVLAAKNPYERRAPASLTKIMTALVALENASLDETISVSSRAARIGGSTLGVRAGERVELWKILYGMLFRSGNDAALAIAESIGGSQTRFAQMMNEKARKLGAYNTNFLNPHGLPQAGHYSTAYDLAIIARAAMKNEVFAKIVGRTERNVIWNNYEREIVNINKFLTQYAGATGVKTGYASVAGYCLAASASRDGRNLIAIILNDRSSDARWWDAARLMDYGFQNYQALMSAPSNIRNVYTVRSGETLSDIANRLGVTVASLVRNNSLRDPDSIYPGQKLYLP
ncbi:MAG: LysM peptidoglycan-binding domain-containing protein [Syntrophothermus sp.]